MYEPLIPIDGVVLCVASLIIYFNQRRKSMYKSTDWQALHNKYIMNAKKYVSKRLNKTSRVHIPKIGTDIMPAIVRSHIVHVATTSDNKKIYMHAHNM